MSFPTHPRMDAWLELSGALLDAAEAATHHLSRRLRRRRSQSFATRRPGPDTPMWNALATALRAELRVLGSQARLARHLGIPKQRLRDFLKVRTRMPDAELTLYLLHWLTQKRAGRDLAL